MLGIFGNSHAVCVRLNSDGTIDHMASPTKFEYIHEYYKNGDKIYIANDNEMDCVLDDINKMVYDNVVDAVRDSIKDMIEYNLRFGEDLNLFDKDEILKVMEYNKRHICSMYSKLLTSDDFYTNMLLNSDMSEKYNSIGTKLLSYVLSETNKNIEKFMATIIDVVSAFDFYGDVRYVSIDELERMYDSITFDIRFI